MMTAKFNSIFRAIALTAAVCVVMPVFGQTTKARVDVPLAFEVGTESMPAGQYTFERDTTSWQMLITDPAGVTRAVMTTPVGDPRSPIDGKLVFEKTGDSYRLAEIHLAGAPNGVKVPATKTQIELAKRQRPQHVEVAMVTNRARK